MGKCRRCGSKPVVYDRDSTLAGMRDWTVACRCRVYDQRILEVGEVPFTRTIKIHGNGAEVIVEVWDVNEALHESLVGAGVG